MSHAPSPAFEDSFSYKSGSGRFVGQRAMLLAVTLTAAHPGSALARGPVAIDAATATIRVSVSPYYDVARVSPRETMRREPADGPCLATNATVPSMPVNGAWVSQNGIVEFTIPACSNHRPSTASDQIREGQKTAILLLVYPE